MISLLVKLEYGLFDNYMAKGRKANQENIPFSIILCHMHVSFVHAGL